MDGFVDVSEKVIKGELPNLPKEVDKAVNDTGNYTSNLWSKVFYNAEKGEYRVVHCVEEWDGDYEHRDMVECKEYLSFSVSPSNQVTKTTLASQSVEDYHATKLDVAPVLAAWGAEFVAFVDKSPEAVQVVKSKK